MACCLVFVEPFDLVALAAENGSDGVTLLQAYALDLDPNQNLSSSLPHPLITSEQMILTFYAGSEGVTYAVETSFDLQNWSTDGVSLSAPDPISKKRTATVNLTAARRFMRLAVTVP